MSLSPSSQKATGNNVTTSLTETLTEMKKIIILILAAIIPALASWTAGAQEVPTAVDTTVFMLPPTVDSTLVGKSVFNLLTSQEAGKVSLHQSQAIVNAMKAHFGANPSRTLTGYRVRIFFDNSQNARGASETALNSFREMHPAVPAYRSYQNPFFKVAVGDFRTKSEAMEFLQKVKGTFPASFVVKEQIHYPSVL